jgi:LemA protein
MKWVIIVGLIVAVFYGYGKIRSGFDIYNIINALSTTLDQAGAEVQSQYQRRSDLVPNIEASVRGEAKFEKGTLEAVTNARARATSITLTKEALDDPETMKRFNRAQGDLTTAMSRLMVASENYPTLRANDAFKDLRTTLEGTENRIAVARNRYNKAAGNYNVVVSRWPEVIVAKIAGFKHRDFFTADADAQKAPKVNLD